MCFTASKCVQLSEIVLWVNDLCYDVSFLYKAPKGQLTNNPIRDEAFYRIYLVVSPVTKSALSTTLNQITKWEQLIEMNTAL